MPAWRGAWRSSPSRPVDTGLPTLEFERGCPPATRQSFAGTTAISGALTVTAPRVSLAMPDARRAGPAPRLLDWRHGRPTPSTERDTPGVGRGYLLPPFYVHDREEPYRIELATWLELPDDLIVGQEVAEAGERSGALARVLGAALERPAAGSPRRPASIRVADASLAAEVRTIVGDSIPVRVAPTPELDELLEFMLETLPDEADEESYLDGGRISADAVEALFVSSQALFRVAPWTVAAVNQVLRMDIPALGVDGACVSIIGEGEQDRGLLVFPSLDGYKAFLTSGIARQPSQRRVDMGTNWFALTFDSATELPRLMRREAAGHGWPVAGADAYPRLRRFDRDGASPPLVEEDLKIATAGASALATFFIMHRSRFESDAFDPVCELFKTRGLEVRLTAPYEAFDLFDVDETPAQRRAPHHDLDVRLLNRLGAFAERRFGAEWRRFERDFSPAFVSLQLSAPWSVYCYQVQGSTVLEWYLQEHGQQLTRTERAWLAAQQAAWLSIWEVIEVEPGASLTLRDLLSGEERRVHEVRGSQTLVVRDTLLARIVEQDGVSVLCGVHPRQLPPLDASEVLRRARGRLGRKRAVPVERLRDAKFGGYLIRRWREAVAELDHRRTTPPDLRNTEGDSLLMTTDHFELVPGARAAVEKQLSTLDGAERADDDADCSVLVFFRQGNVRQARGERTLIGQAMVSDTTLRIETNSWQRADALRGRIEAACGKEVRHRIREHTDPLSSRVIHAQGELDAGPSSPEAEEARREWKRRHYADWPDQPLPALLGKSPREAVRTVSGRANVDLLLKVMENREQRIEDGAPFDFGEIRRSLGLE